jgi:hypothetical protein
MVAAIFKIPNGIFISWHMWRKRLYLSYTKRPRWKVCGSSENVMVDYAPCFIMNSCLELIVVECSIWRFWMARCCKHLHGLLDISGEAVATLSGLLCLGKA